MDIRPYYDQKLGALNPCPTSRLHVHMMSLPTECLFQVSNHTMYVFCHYSIYYMPVLRPRFYGYSPEVRNLIEVISHLISKLDILYSKSYSMVTATLNSYRVASQELALSLHVYTLSQTHTVTQFLKYTCSNPALEP